MKYFVVFLLLITYQLSAQETERTEKVTATILNDSDSKPLANVNIINLNSVKGTITDEKGIFEISAQTNDTLHISLIGFQSIRVRVTNDWLKSKNTQIKLTEKAIALEEVVLTPYNLTGYLQVDAKLIPVNTNQRYGISGLNYGYEAGQYSPNAFQKLCDCSDPVQRCMGLRDAFAFLLFHRDLQHIIIVMNSSFWWNFFLRS